MVQTQKTLATIWRASDDLWKKLKAIFDEYDPPNPVGRKRIDVRAALDAVIFRLRSGCQSNQLPAEFPDDSSVHRTFQRWEKNGVLDQVSSPSSQMGSRADTQLALQMSSHSGARLT